MKNKLWKISAPFVLVAFGVAMIAPGVIWATDEDETKVTLKDIKDIKELRAAFDADKGTVRLILLLSPT